VRILLAVAMLGMTASCILPQPPEYVAAQPAAPAPGPVVAAPAAPAEPAMLPAPELALYVPSPLGWLFPGFAPAPAPGRLTLSNFTYDDARVQAVVTPFPDCQERPGIAVSDFELPLNGTRIIATPPGSDICWRRALPAGPDPTRPGVEIIEGWTDWSRVFTASGRSIDSRL
jgi:hypothetical protein